MDQAIVKELMKKAGFNCTKIKKLDYGANLYFDNDSNVVIYNTGKMVIQGKGKTVTESILSTNSSLTTIQDVFVVYGHDTSAKQQLELMLRRWKLNPIILDQQPTEGSTIIESLEKHMTKANFGIVIATPDDIGYAVGREDEKKYHVRQNVVLEMGMLFAMLGRNKVAILLKKTDDMSFERPSDIDGLLYIEFKNSVEECKEKLSKQLCTLGYSIDIMDL